MWKNADTALTFSAIAFEYFDTQKHRVCIEMHSCQSHARHSPARHGDLNFSGGDHSRERLEIRETRHIHQPAHHCGHGAGGVLGKDTVSIPHSVDLEWVRV